MQSQRKKVENNTSATLRRRLERSSERKTLHTQSRTLPWSWKTQAGRHANVRRTPEPSVRLTCSLDRIRERNRVEKGIGIIQMHMKFKEKKTEKIGSANMHRRSMALTTSNKTHQKHKKKKESHKKQKRTRKSKREGGSANMRRRSKIEVYIQAIRVQNLVAAYNTSTPKSRSLGSESPTRFPRNTHMRTLDSTSSQISRSNPRTSQETIKKLTAREREREKDTVFTSPNPGGYGHPSLSHGENHLLPPIHDTNPNLPPPSRRESDRHLP